jgi:uncharacterized coiled-coil protein SlyX
MNMHWLGWPWESQSKREKKARDRLTARLSPWVAMVERMAYDLSAARAEVQRIKDAVAAKETRHAAAIAAKDAQIGELASKISAGELAITDLQGQLTEVHAENVRLTDELRALADSITPAFDPSANR